MSAGAKLSPKRDHSTLLAKTSVPSQQLSPNSRDQGSGVVNGGASSNCSTFLGLRKGLQRTTGCGGSGPSLFPTGSESMNPYSMQVLSIHLKVVAHFPKLLGPKLSQTPCVST